MHQCLCGATHSVLSLVVLERKLSSLCQTLLLSHTLGSDQCLLTAERWRDEVAGSPRQSLGILSLILSGS